MATERPPAWTDGSKARMVMRTDALPTGMTVVAGNWRGHLPLVFVHIVSHAAGKDGVKATINAPEDDFTLGAVAGRAKALVERLQKAIEQTGE